MTAPPLCCPRVVFSYKREMCTTCYSRVSQQPLSQAQIHISWSSVCVGGQTPFHLATDGKSPYMCVNFTASFSRQLPAFARLIRLLTERGIHQCRSWLLPMNHNARQCALSGGDRGRQKQDIKKNRDPWFKTDLTKSSRGDSEGSPGAKWQTYHSAAATLWLNCTIFLSLKYDTLL